MVPVTNGEDTIAAMATPPGEGGIAVIRISGPGALAVADGVFVSNKSLRPSAQKAYTAQYGYVTASGAPGGSKIDDVVLTVMRGPKSYTGEDTVEISCHGGRIVVQKVLEACFRCGARPAGPGEFTKRAFLNGRLDLVQAETVADLIRAKSERAFAAARSHLEGKFSERIRRLRDDCAQILSHLEASIDFPEDDPETLTGGEVTARLAELRREVRALELSSGTARVIKEGLKVVITGRPNAGKSSLLNALCGRERVIVDASPGTTRDTVEETIEIRGIPVRLIDTAGIRNADERVESESVRRSRAAAEEADLALFVVDGSVKPTREEERYWECFRDGRGILVENKSDLPPAGRHDGCRRMAGGSPRVRTSCLRGEGLDRLREEIAAFISERLPERSDDLWVYSVRQADLLKKASKHLEDTLGAAGRQFSPEFAAADLRLAMDALGQIVGEVVTDDILDLIFSQFCIGK